MVGEGGGGVAAAEGDRGAVESKGHIDEFDYIRGWGGAGRW